MSSSELCPVVISKKNHHKHKFLGLHVVAFNKCWEKSIIIIKGNDLYEQAINSDLNAHLNTCLHGPEAYLYIYLGTYPPPTHTHKPTYVFFSKK